MQRMLKIALLAVVGLPAASQAQAPAAGAADTASAWSAPEGTYVVGAEGRSVTIRVTRTDAGLAATLQKGNDPDVVTAQSVAVNGPELVIRFQPEEEMLTMTLRRSGAKVTAVLEGEGERHELEGTKNG